MNKLAIPALLGMVVLIAGIFAFVPVGEAATVHDSVNDDIQTLGDAICDLDGGGGVDNSHVANLDTGVCDAVGEA